MSIVVTGIEKKGPVIICSTNDPKERVYKLDFQNAKIYGITGKPIQSTNIIVDKIPSTLWCNNILAIALHAFDRVPYCTIPFYYNIVESLLSYPDLVPLSIDMMMVEHLHDYCNDKLPKGFVSWCRMRGKKFYLQSLEQFLSEYAAQQWPKPLANFVKQFAESTNFNFARETHGDKDLCIDFMHIVHNSLKRYEFEDLLGYVSKILGILERVPKTRPYLDSTKSAKVAYEILNDVINAERNKKVLANEARIAALNGVVVSGLMIKVPASMEDFTDEGKQQHNCVGHYYHDAVAQGNTLIYFLRSSDDPDQSYITCRYMISSRKTVEHRTRFNHNYDNKPLFEEIDALIAKVLGI